MGGVSGQAKACTTYLHTMDTVTFNSVRVKANTLFAGKASPTSDDSASLATFINARAREFWEAYYWPELMTVEKRTFRAQYSAANTYVAAQEVYYPSTQLYYVALRAVPTNQPPDTGLGSPLSLNTAYWAESLGVYSGDNWSNTAAYAAGTPVYQPLDGNFYQSFTATTNNSPPNASFWGLLVPFVRSIDLVGGNQGASATSLGWVKQCWDADPLADFDGACPQPFDRYATRLVVRGEAQVVWVEFRLRVNDFSGANWSSSTAYVMGNQVYYPVTGEYYVCILGNTNSVPTTTANWTKLDFPAVLAPASAQAAYGDMLKLAGKANKSDNEYGEALRLLRREWNKLERLEHHTNQLNVLVRT